MDSLLLDRNVLMILIGVVLFSLIGLGVIGFQMLGKPARQMRKRLERASLGTTAQANVDRRVSVRRSNSESSIPTVEKLARRLIPRPAAMRQRLDKTGKKISLGLYLLVSLLIGLLGMMAVINLLGLSALTSGLFGLAFAILVPYLGIGFMIGRRVKKFIRNFPDAIDIIVRGLRSGLPVSEAMTIVSREMAGPVAEEFTKITDGMRMGQQLDHILWETADRMGIAEFRFFVIAMSIQRETGGNLAETLENLSDVLRKRLTMRLKVRALSSEARASAVIIGALPFVMMGLIMMLNPEYIGQLFVDPRGVFMLVFAGISLCVGIFVMAKMIKFEI